MPPDHQAYPQGGPLEPSYTRLTFTNSVHAPMQEGCVVSIIVIARGRL